MAANVRSAKLHFARLIEHFFEQVRRKNANEWTASVRREVPSDAAPINVYSLDYLSF